jgi:predicted alpha/beta hydrolase
VTVPTDPPPYQQEWLDHDAQRLGRQVYPEPDGAAPAVVIFPAMGVPARFYRPFASELTGAGVAVTVVDLRGTGASTPPPSRKAQYGYAELVDDVAAVRRALKPRLDGRRVVLLGHSLGGQACLLHLATAGEHDVAGLALVGVGLPYWRSYHGRRRHGVLALTQSIHLASTLLRVWPGWGFGGRQSRGVIRDWAYTARTGRFPHLGNIHAETAVRTVRTPVLAVSFENDQYTPHSTMDALLAKLPLAPVLREHYDSGADHFTWARTAGPTAARVAEFARTGR